MNQYQRRSLEVLDRCLNLRVDNDDNPAPDTPTRQQRLEDLIAEFITGKRPAI
jgi:hypothetical protein